MKLSIITINYNNKAGLQKTIDSVVSQTFKDFEWIIIDGGSTDGSKELIEQYSQYITYWVSEPDKGIYNAMNKGIIKANGDYLLFLNSGDSLVEKKTLYHIFRDNHNEEILYGNIIYDNEIKTKNIGFHSNNLTLLDLFKGNMPHQASLIKKKLFDSYGLYDERIKISADWKFFLITIIINKCSVKYLNVDVSYFDTTGYSFNSKPIWMKERIEIIKDLFPHYIIEDYQHNLYTDEIRKYKISKIFHSLLYRCVILYERIRFNNYK